MSGKVYAGERVRQARERLGMTQGALAAASGLSPSYLNQIERNQRPLSASALIRLSAQLGVEPAYFADDTDLRLASALREALGDPIFAGAGAAAGEAKDCVRAAPAMAGEFVRLYRAYQALGEEYRSLRERVGADPALSGAAPFPYDEVRDLFQLRRNHFEAIDHAAERFAEAADIRTGRALEDLAGYLADRHGVEVRVVAGLTREGVLWRFDQGQRLLAIAENAPRESRAFFLAHQLALLEHGALIDAEVERAGLGSAEARGLARTGLANYFAGAVLLPYGRFLAEARRLRHDVERLQAVFGTSFEQVCHRLSTLQRPGNPGIPFYFMKVDLAGNISKRSSANRFQFARFGGACPLWNVHQAFNHPGQVLVQLAQTPDGVGYLCVARTVTSSGGAYLARPREAAVGFGCEVAHADQLVYAAGLDLRNLEAAVPVGPGCRVCDRESCRHRAFPPVGRSLRVDGLERRVVPYAVTLG